ncbi:MAG: alpha/beta hydrolase, partial [Chloroflexi bacterium]|nr:alpha/beta hydrolase [Chloroflexota bacterium]
KAVVLIHGAGGNRTHWPKSLRPLTPHPTYVLDLPGHGRSPLPGCQTISDYADSVVQFIEIVLPDKEIVLVGHSMGGAIVQMVALQQLPQLAGIALIGTSARLGVSPAILDNVLTEPQIAIDFVARYAWSKSAPEQLIEQSKQLLSSVPKEVLHGDFLACSTFDLRGQLHEIIVPALVISGSDDQMTPAKYGRLLANELPNAQYHNLEGSGHYIMLERAEKAAQVLQDFLQSL